jgi:selenoprotein W-related protein
LVAAFPSSKVLSACTGTQINKTYCVEQSKPQITIEYCPKCGWLLRSAYMAQELLTTFSEELGGVLLRPSQISGRFTVFAGDEIIFDRKRERRFPEIKELKQLVRDKVAPQKSLGHSDNIAL